MYVVVHTWALNALAFTMVNVREIVVHPPLLNTSCAWASDLRQLTELYECPQSGAVTTRTATLPGFEEDSSHTVGNCQCFVFHGLIVR